MAARKKVTKSRATKKPTRTSAAPKRAPAKVKAKARVAKKKAPVALGPATRTPTSKTKSAKAASKKKSAKATSKTNGAKATSKTNGAKATSKTSGATSRRDPTGHLNPKYAADLRARSRASAEDVGSDNAFLRKARAHDPLAEELGEEAVMTMTSGEDQSDRLQDMEVEEERGGPFVTTSAREEFARGTDESNPADGLREPFPTT